VRCSALGYTFDRGGLDEIYRRFVVLVSLGSWFDNSTTVSLRPHSASNPYNDPAGSRIVVVTPIAF